MGNFLKVVVFSLIIIVSFAGYSGWGIPQIKPAPPPTEEKLDLGAMTMDRFIALGEKIFKGKGACTLCHNELGRAPMLDNAAATAAERLADPGYQGTAETVEEFLYESLVDPTAYVVAGFGKKGTNDTVSPMTDVSAGSTRLSEAEISALIAYLQDLAGAEVTVEIPTGVAEDDGEEDDEEGEARAPLESAEEVIEEFACGACHVIAGEEGELGPDLSKIGADRDRDFLRRSILDPDVELTEGFEAELMPPDYGEQMYAKELEMLLDYMAGLKEGE